MTDPNYNSAGRSVLAALRESAPLRPLRFSEALRVAEWQATRLLALHRVETAPVPSTLVSEMPRIRVLAVDLPTSGMSFWERDCWVIYLNRHEPPTRQRFTLFHEFKHIVDHGRLPELYPGSEATAGDQQAEQAADYFAGCVLVPRLLLKREWSRGVQQVNELARHFNVSPSAVAVRLAQTGLSDAWLPSGSAVTGCGQRSRPGAYYRAATNRSSAVTEELRYA